MCFHLISLSLGNSIISMVEKSKCLSVIGLIVLAVLIGTGYVFANWTLTTFIVLAAVSVVIRHIRATAPLRDLVDIILLYQALLLVVWRSGVCEYVPSPFPELAIAIGLLGFNRYSRGRAWGDMTLRLPESWRAWVPAFPFTVLSIAGLAGWYFFVAERPHPMVKFLPPWSTTALLAAAPIVAMANALLEEFWARVILQSEARRVAGVWPAIVFQAVLFAAMHYQAGFPSGWLGAGLTFAFGFVMGLLTHRTRSVWPAVVVHFLCDAFIMTMLVLDRG